MKKLMMLPIVLLLSGIIIPQQTLNDLNTPTAPAAWIIGLQPNSILAPKTFQALEASLYSNFMNSSGGITVPDNYALEFSPYWATKPKLSFSDYMLPKKFFKDQIVRNSSFSIASTKNFVFEDSTKTNSIGFGYRVNFYMGSESDEAKVEKFKKDFENSASPALKIITAATKMRDGQVVKNPVELGIMLTPRITETMGKYCDINGLSDKRKAEIINKIVLQISDLPDLSDASLNKLNNIVFEQLELEAIFKEFKSYIKERHGLSFDLGFAAMVNFPTNNFEFSVSPHQALWITPTYRFADDWSIVKILGVLRYEQYNTDYYQKYFPTAKFYDNNIDYGVGGQLDFKKFSLQFEIVGRSSNTEIAAGVDALGRKLYTKETSSDIQYSGTFSYHLDDQITLSYNLGNLFKPAVNPNSTLLSMLSVNFGFGAPTKEDLTVK
ncbi:MAG: hypothetical protein HYV28_18050 [Ignavibacteriales bacterium]|nr:hypothetical protein [Ignavibacteriales bacterium]